MSDLSVLFVDDEPITRKISSRLLGRQYPVIEAEDGQHALNLLATQSDQVGVVITDMKMGNIDGMTLIEILSRDYPLIPIIASTGNLENYDFATLIADGKVFSAIEKPWDLTNALKIVGAAFEQRSRN